MLTMHETYRDKFPEFLAAVIGGESSEDAIRHVYGKSAKELEHDLGRYLNGFTIPVMTYGTEWGKEKRDYEPRPVESAEEDLMLADLLAVLGRTDEARKQFQAALEIDDQSAEAYAGLGRTAIDDESAVKDLSRAVGLGSDNAYVYLDYVRALLRQGGGASEELLKALAKAAELRPELVDTHLLLAAFSRQSGNHGQELLHLRRARGIDPVGGYARARWMAEAAFDSGSSTQALVAATEAARYVNSERQLEDIHRMMQPTDAPVVGAFVQIDAWIEAGELDSTASALAALQKRFQDGVPIYERFSKVQQLRGDAAAAEVPAAATQHLRHAAVFERKRFSEAANRRISLLDAGGFYDRSQVFSATLVELDPENSTLLNNRAYVLAEKGVLLDAAAEMAERALQLHKEEPAFIRDTLGWVYAKAQRNDEALAIFERLIDEDRKQAFYQYHYGVVLNQLDRKTDAMKAFERALDSKTISDAFRKTIQEARDELTKAPEAE